MHLHAIVLVDENDQVANRIAEHYPLSRQFNEKVFLVRTEEVSQQVAVKVGIKGDDRIDDALGAVFKLYGAYAGHAPSSLWEWLDSGEER